MFQFVIRHTQFGWTKGDIVDLISLTVEQAGLELFYIGFAIGKDGLLVLSSTGQAYRA